MWHDCTVFAVVPARGGSKGVTRKNLQHLAGLSLVAHAARFVADLDWLDASFVSTDDNDIRDEAVQHGLAAPFLRPAALSGDEAEAIDVWRHAWTACEESAGQTMELGLYLEPTSPLRQVDDVERCLEAVTHGGYRTAATVSPTPPSFSFQKSLQIDDTGRLDFLALQGERTNQRQLVPRTWHRNGLCYAAMRDAIFSDEDIVGTSCAGIEVSRRIVNIDEVFDFRVAELILQGETSAIETAQ